jgi:hypothetical protein
VGMSKEDLEQCVLSKFKRRGSCIHPKEDCKPELVAWLKEVADFLLGQVLENELSLIKNHVEVEDKGDCLRLFDVVDIRAPYRFDSISCQSDVVKERVKEMLYRFYTSSNRGQ